MIKIFKYVSKAEWLQVLISLVFIVAGVGLDLQLPDYMAEITTLIQTPGSAISAVWIAGGKMLICALGGLVTSVIVGYFAARIAASFSARLRSMLYASVDSFSAAEMSRFSTASLITRSTNDVTQVQMIVTLGLQMIIKAPIMAVWAVAKIAGKGIEWTWATLIALAVLFLVITVLLAFMLPKFKKVQGLTDDVNRLVQENLNGLRVVRAYNAEDYQEDKFNKTNKELTETQLFTGRSMAILSPFMSLTMNGLSLSIYIIGAVLINSAAAAAKLALFSNMVVFSSYAMQVIAAFIMLAMIFILLPRASVSAKRINEVLDTKPTIKDGTASQGKADCTGNIVFDNVSFKYPGSTDYVIQDISFTAHKGETVAVIGSTGSGKSTLINLVPRFYDTTEGSVSVGGVNVKDYTQKSLRNKIGYVPQKAVLFKGTVRSNIAYGENGADAYNDADVQQALAISQSANFVENMEGKANAAISQGGTNVSGGQKQRLSIARAVCRKPEIYIFDDSFSALDFKTDRMLRSALKKETAGVTSLIVAQRIGTIMDADQIIVLDEGRMVGKGTHHELLKNCEVYRQIAESQLSQEDLKNA